MHKWNASIIKDTLSKLWKLCHIIKANAQGQEDEIGDEEAKEMIVEDDEDIHIQPVRKLEGISPSKSCTTINDITEFLTP